MGRTETVVVGGGCSGALTALRELAAGRDVTVVEAADDVARGLAYRTTDPAHLLNSRAETMSADPTRPADFASWLAGHGEGGPHTFAPRGRYGDYLVERLDAAAARHPGRLRTVRGRAARVLAEPGAGVRVALADGRDLDGARAVLAVGHGPPRPPAALAALRGDPRLLADPWRAGALATVPADAPVVLLGTGLTAVDVALTLAGRGHRGPVVAVSRRGLLPREHAAAPPPAVPPVRAGTLRGLLRAVRCAADAGDWRAVVDALRPDLDTLWAGLTPPERERFLRHVARYWEIHRHRLPPASAAAVRRLRAAGALDVLGGRVRGAEPTARGLLLHVETADGGRALPAGAVVNCTGPGSCLDTPLVAALRRDGLVRPDPLELGLDVTPDGRAVRADGTATAGLLVVGPPRRGTLWETTAVPEIRAQAAGLAAARPGWAGR